jgi:hypothetical protein
MYRDMTAGLYNECQLRGEFRRGFDLGAVSQNESVDIAASGERELLHLTAQRRKLLRIVDRGRHARRSRVGRGRWGLGERELASNGERQDAHGYRC